MEKKTEGSGWESFAAKLFCLLAGVLLGYLAVRYAGRAALVFLIAWAVAAVIDPLARKTEKHLRLPRKLCAAVYVTVLLGLLGLVLFFAVRRLVRELEGLLEWLSDNGAVVVQKLGEAMEYLGALPAKLTGVTAGEGDGAEILRDSVTSMVSGVINETVSGLGTAVTSLLSKLLRAAPEALITLVVTVMACFYLSMDYQGIRDRLIGLLPSRAQMRAQAIRKRGAMAIRGYLRAYVVLFLLTFGQVFVGLLLLRQRYAFLIALLIALVDILPVLGTGTVLIPWAIVMLILGRYPFGFGLLILYGVVTVVRQIAEPSLVGGRLGLHPLASLFFMFLGFQLFGVLGMLLGPFVAFVAKAFLGGGEEMGSGQLF